MSRHQMHSFILQSRPGSWDDPLPSYLSCLFHTDMDGTLTIPCIDFGEMRRRAGVPAGQDILDAINGWPEAERRERAYAAIAEVEEEALKNMKVGPRGRNAARGAPPPTRLHLDPRMVGPRGRNAEKG